MNHLIFAGSAIFIFLTAGVVLTFFLVGLYMTAISSGIMIAPTRLSLSESFLVVHR